MTPEETAGAERAAMAIKRKIQDEVLAVLDPYQGVPFCVLDGLVEIVGDRFVKVRQVHPVRARSWCERTLAQMQLFVAPTHTRAS